MVSTSAMMVPAFEATDALAQSTAPAWGLPGLPSHPQPGARIGTARNTDRAASSAVIGAMVVRFISIFLRVRMLRRDYGQTVRLTSVV